MYAGLSKCMNEPADSKQLNGFYNLSLLMLAIYHARCSQCRPVAMEEDGLMEDAILYLQTKIYRVGANENEKRIISYS